MTDPDEEHAEQLAQDLGCYVTNTRVMRKLRDEGWILERIGRQCGYSAETIRQRLLKQQEPGS